MTYEEWGQKVQLVPGQEESHLARMYADWTADRKSRAKKMAEDVSAVLDEALNMGDGTYKP